MIRYTVFILIAAASAASALAAISPASRGGLAVEGKNVTVIEKNQAFPLVGPLIVEQCLTDDCSVTRS